MQFLLTWLPPPPPLLLMRRGGREGVCKGSLSSSLLFIGGVVVDACALCKWVKWMCLDRERRVNGRHVYLSLFIDWIIEREPRHISTLSFSFMSKGPRSKSTWVVQRQTNNEKHNNKRETYFHPFFSSLSLSLFACVYNGPLCCCCCRCCMNWEALLWLWSIKRLCVCLAF